MKPLSKVKGFNGQSTEFLWNRVIDVVYSQKSFSTWQKNVVIKKIDSLQPAGCMEVKMKALLILQLVHHN